jgi:hypothetical protein
MKFWAEPKKLYNVLKRAHSVVTDRAKYSDRTRIPYNVVDVLQIKVNQNHVLKITTIFKEIRSYSNKIKDLIVTEEPGEIHLINHTFEILKILKTIEKDWICVSLSRNYILSIDNFHINDCDLKITDTKILYFSTEGTEYSSGIKRIIDSKVLFKELKLHQMIPVRATVCIKDEIRKWILGCLINLKLNVVEFISTDAIVLFKSEIKIKDINSDSNDSLVIPIHSIEQGIKFLAPLRSEIDVYIEKSNEDRLFILRSKEEIYKVLLHETDDGDKTPGLMYPTITSIDVNQYIEISIIKSALCQILSEFIAYCEINEIPFLKIIWHFEPDLKYTKIIFNCNDNPDEPFSRTLLIGRIPTIKKSFKICLSGKICVKFLKLTKNIKDIKLYVVPESNSKNIIHFKLDDKIFVVAQTEIEDEHLKNY